MTQGKSDYSRIEQAIRYLVEQAGEQPSLEDLARHLGVSEFHCHRLFKKWAGITPKDFLQIVTLAKAKALLTSEKTVFDASDELGLSGSSRLHDLFIRYEAMTPGEYKNGGAGLEIEWSRFESPLGGAVVAQTKRGICALSFVDSDADALEFLREHWPNAHFTKNAKALSPAVSELKRRMIGGKKSRKLSLHLKGTPFQVKVWEALLRIPEGKVTTYQSLARRIGKPKAVRAVGSAVGANPVGYLIPCHRVIRSTGAVGDYHWGAARKTAILALESGRK